MIEVGMCQEHEINRREVFDFQTGTFDALQEEQPVREVGIHELVQVGELDEKRGVANPRHRDLAEF